MVPERKIWFAIVTQSSWGGAAFLRVEASITTHSTGTYDIATIIWNLGWDAASTWKVRGGVCKSAVRDSSRDGTLELLTSESSLLPLHRLPGAIIPIRSDKLCQIDSPRTSLACGC
jgi:hypothetical protein